MLTSGDAPSDPPAHDDLPPTPPAVTGPPGPPPMTRGRAVAEAVLCSSYPTQIVAAALLAAAGLASSNGAGTINPTFIITVSLLDAVLVVGLIVYLLRRRGESVASVMLGQAPWGREAMVGAALVLPVTFGVAGLVVAVRALWPSLQNVPVNPMTALMADPERVVLFAVVVVFAGGVREEMQRAFQLHRLAPTVLPGGAALLLTSVAFGLGHTLQGYDVAVATFGLGLLWGAMWLRRRSIVAPAVCHALFNLTQVWAASQLQP